MLSLSTWARLSRICADFLSWFMSLLPYLLCRVQRQWLSESLCCSPKPSIRSCWLGVILWAQPSPGPIVLSILRSCFSTYPPSHSLALPGGRSTLTSFKSQHMVSLHHPRHLPPLSRGRQQPSFKVLFLARCHAAFNFCSVTQPTPTFNPSLHLQPL